MVANFQSGICYFSSNLREMIIIIVVYSKIYDFIDLIYPKLILNAENCFLMNFTINLL
jgi:hypothetical protein